MPAVRQDRLGAERSDDLPNHLKLQRLPDGSIPDSGLVDLNGTLHGTTPTGGSSSIGTVYSVGASGSEKALHSFTGTPDGSSPYSGTIVVGRALYGTTLHGGAHGDGAVFKITKAGKVSIVYSFDGVPGGAEPSAGLLSDGATLCSTTFGGGSTGNGNGILRHDLRR